MLLNEQGVKEEIKKQIFKILKIIGGINTTCQYLWDTAEAVLKKFTAISADIKKQARHQVNKLIIHLKEPEKQQ